MRARFDVLQYTNSRGDLRSADLVVAADAADVAFWNMDKYRTFSEFLIPTATTLVFKIVVPVATLLTVVEFDLISSEVRLDTAVAGTEGGVFTSVPTFNMNNIVAAPASQVLLSVGGTHTGGTRIDSLWAKAGNNANFASSVGKSEGGTRGIAPNTYYWKLVNTDGADAKGVFRAQWTEIS